MSNTSNGGPAFPTEQFSDRAMSAMLSGGMTLRDYFAAKAMNGLLASITKGDNIEVVPALSYQMADEMLKAREKS